MVASGRKKSNPKKTNENRSNGVGLSRRAAKVAQTRELILSAATNVFTRYPFGAAGIRMIEEEGKFNHSSIYYHFKTKSELFEAVVFNLYEDYLVYSRDILASMGRKPLREELSDAIDRILDIGFRKPDILKLMMLNIGDSDHVEEMSGGFQYFRKYNEIVHDLFRRTEAFRASRRTITMWISAFNILIANYLGNPALFRQAFCADANENEYRAFIKNTLTTFFYPSLKALLFPDAIACKHPPGTKRNKLKPLRTAAKEIKVQTPSRQTKGDTTRARILDVARSVFARNPYGTASIRMIGDAGDFDFTLLYHYFPTKADLFEAVVGEIFEELAFFLNHLTVEMEEESLRESLSMLIDGVVDYFWSHPEGFMVFMQNVAQINTLEDFPGARHLLGIIASAQDKYRLEDEQSNDEIRGVIYSIGIIVINLLGASTLNGGILCINPKSARYKRWVKDTLMFISYPALKAHLERWPDWSAIKAFTT